MGVDIAPVDAGFGLFADHGGVAEKAAFDATSAQADAVDARAVDADIFEDLQAPVFGGESIRRGQAVNALGISNGCVFDSFQRGCGSGRRPLSAGRRVHPILATVGPRSRSRSGSGRAITLNRVGVVPDTVELTGAVDICGEEEFSVGGGPEDF